MFGKLQESENLREKSYFHMCSYSISEWNEINYRYVISSFVSQVIICLTYFSDILVICMLYKKENFGGQKINQHLPSS